MAETFFERRRKELGLDTPTPNAGSSSGESDFFERRKMELGLVPDTRPKAVTVDPFKTTPETTKMLDDANMNYSGNVERFGVFSKGVQDKAAAKKVADEAAKLQKRTDLHNASPLKKVSNALVDLAEPVTSRIASLLPGDNRAITTPGQRLGKMIDKTTINVPGKVDDAVANFLRGAGRTASFGASDYIDRELGQEDRANAAIDTTAGKIGGYAGYVAPGAIAERLIATGGKALIKNLPNIAKFGITGASAGAAAGVANEAGEFVTGQNDQSLRQRAIDVGIEMGAGGLLGAAIPAIGAGMQRGFKSLMRPTLDASADMSNAINSVARENLPQSVRRTVSADAVPEIFPERYRRTFGEPPTVASPNPVRATTEPQGSNTAKPLYNMGDEAIPTSADGTELSKAAKIIDIQSKDGVNYYRFDGSNTYMPENQVKGAAQQPSKIVQERDELKFAQTVRGSENTSSNLIDALNDTPMVGARTSDVLNRQQAAKMIERHGQEGLYSTLLSKKKQFSAAETTAAQILAKQFSSLGGEENLKKAIELVSKTARGGREMGQAIQALSQWNKLDETGALYLGEKVINKGLPTDEWKTLTVAQGAPIKEAAQRIGSAQETRSLADEVLSIVTNKQAGQALTDAEKATIKQFQDQVKLINEKGKGILSKPKANKVEDTIKEVSQIEPKARTRDQVVNFLDAKAEKARQRLAKSRNIGLMPDLNNPVFDYAIIGASKIAKGTVKLSDFTEQMVKDFGEKVRPHINEVFTKATNMFRKENGLPTVEQLDRVVRNAVKNDRFTESEATQFKAWASEIGHMSDEFKREATQDLQAAMKELGDSTLGRQLSTLQTGAMLLNSVTMERNVIGNVAQMVGEKVNKVATVPIDWTLSKLTGEQRTIYFKTMNQENFWENFLAGTKAGWKGVSPNGMLDSYGIHPNVFSKKNPLKYVSKLLGASMQGFDHAFYSAAKGDVLATYAENLGKAQGLSKAEIKSGMKGLIMQLDDRIHELADHAGKYATYQDETLLSRGAEGLKKGLNELSTGMVSRKLVDMGLPKSLSMEGFGAGDVLTKFAKTPANLVMRGLDYSPIGFIRSLVDLGYFVGKRERFDQHQAVRTLGRAITGTVGLTGMGYILADAGVLSGSSSMDKDTRSIQEQSGQGAYKVNWSALSRFITSGLDYKAAEFQKGDRLMDYQWLQPAAISLAMGVNANKTVKDKKEGADITGWQMARKAILGGLQTVLENPMLQGVSNLVDATNDVYKRGDATKFRNIGKGVPASFVPTLLNQWRAATDNKQRETFSANMLTEMGNMMKNKVPGLSKKLPVSFDSLGNARERIQGGKENTVTQYLTAFFSPARMTEYQVSPEAKLVLDLMNDSGDATVLPRIGNKSFSVKQGKNMKDLKVSLTAKQFSEYQQNLGTMVNDKLSQQSGYLTNPDISLEKKVKRVNDILTDMGKKARVDIGTQMGYAKKDIKG